MCVCSWRDWRPINNPFQFLKQSWWWTPQQASTLTCVDACCPSCVTKWLFNHKSVAILQHRGSRRRQGFLPAFTRQQKCILKGLGSQTEELSLSYDGRKRNMQHLMLVENLAAISCWVCGSILKFSFYQQQKIYRQAANFQTLHKKKGWSFSNSLEVSPFICCLLFFSPKVMSAGFRWGGSVIVPLTQTASQSLQIFLDSLSCWKNNNGPTGMSLPDVYMLIDCRSLCLTNNFPPKKFECKCRFFFF